jgi:hypothetical protein
MTYTAIGIKPRRRRKANYVYITTDCNSLIIVPDGKQVVQRSYHQLFPLRNRKVTELDIESSDFSKVATKCKHIEMDSQWIEHEVTNILSDVSVREDCLITQGLEQYIENHTGLRSKFQKRQDRKREQSSGYLSRIASQVPRVLFLNGREDIYQDVGLKSLPVPTMKSNPFLATLYENQKRRKYIGTIDMVAIEDNKVTLLASTTCRPNETINGALDVSTKRLATGYKFFSEAYQISARLVAGARLNSQSIPEFHQLHSTNL